MYISERTDNPSYKYITLLEFGKIYKEFQPLLVSTENFKLEELKISIITDCPPDYNKNILSGAIYKGQILKPDEIEGEDSLCEVNLKEDTELGITSIRNS